MLRQKELLEAIYNKQRFRDEESKRELKRLIDETTDWRKTLVKTIQIEKEQE